METLIYAPDQANYSVEDSSDRLKSNVGHVSNYRRNLPNGNRSIDASWQCSKDIYAYLVQVYRAFIASGGNPFLCDMIMDNANVAESFKTRFVAGSFGLTSIQGETYYVRAKLNVTPNKYNVDILPYMFDASTRKVNIQAQSGSYVLTGNPVIFKLSVIHMAAGAGSYSIIGNIAILKAPDRTIQIGAGSYSVAGQNIDGNIIPNSGIINAQGGAYTLTGNPVTLTKKPADGIMVMQDGMIITRVITAGDNISVINGDGQAGDIEIASSAGSSASYLKGAAWSGGGVPLMASLADVVYLEAQAAGTITLATALGGGGSGSATVEVWKSTYAGALPTAANKISGSSPVTITSASKSQDSVLTGWTTSVAAGDIFAFKLLTCSTFNWLNITLEITP